MSVDRRPDTLPVEVMKSAIADAKSLVPALGAIALEPIMPVIPMEMDAPARLPSIMPSAASFIMAVTKPDEVGMFNDLAYWDIAASVMP